MYPDLTRYTTDATAGLKSATMRWSGPSGLWLWAATMYTLIETARLNSLDPETWLRAVIARIAERLPWNITL